MSDNGYSPKAALPSFLFEKKAHDDMKEEHQPTGEDHLAEIMNELLSLFEKRLLGTKPDREMKVTAHDIQTCLRPFKSGHDKRIQGVLSKGWKELSRKIETNYWSKLRTSRLERLMVRTFAHLLAPYDENPVQDVNFSRRVIPAFIAALSQMMGPELMKEYRHRADALIDHEQKITKQDFDWKDVYSTPMARAITYDVLVYIGQYFVDLERRKNWAVDFFTNNLGKPKSEIDAAWYFDELAFFQMVNAIYADLFKEMEDPHRREELAKRYGNVNLDILTELQEKLAEESKLVFAKSSHIALDPDI